MSVQVAVGSAQPVSGANGGELPPMLLKQIRLLTAADPSSDCQHHARLRVKFECRGHIRRAHFN